MKVAFPLMMVAAEAKKCTIPNMDFTTPSGNGAYHYWTCDCEGAAGSITASGLRTRDGDAWYAQGARWSDTSGTDKHWYAHHSGSKFGPYSYDDGYNYRYLVFAVVNNNAIEYAEMHIDSGTISCGSSTGFDDEEVVPAQSGTFSNGTFYPNVNSTQPELFSEESAAAMGWTAVPGNGFCVDKSGNGAVNRAFGKGNDCMNKCQADRTCPGFASGGQNEECVWHTDVSPTTTGRPASSFVIDHATWPADQPWWSTAKCYKYTGLAMV